MKNWTAPVTLISATVGVLIAAQFKAQATFQEGGLPSRRPEELVVMFKDAETENQRLTQQVEGLRDQVKLASGSGSAEARMPLRWGALEGPGVEIQIADSAKALTKGENPNIALVHNEDLLKIVNELRASGAEAIAVNEQRLVEASEVSCAGPTILVNKTRIAPPFIIRAIGDTETMMAALQLRGGVVEYLQFYGIQVTIAKKPSLLVPMYHGGAAYQFAKPLNAKKPEQN
ncbi:MAG: hypothetical protein JWM80_1326 [Cyanobacteria bacterium RYN_339]|nr:hypothetical protein [Cyanobacteria bacterium RYN_339]